MQTYEGLGHECVLLKAVRTCSKEFFAGSQQDRFKNFNLYELIILLCLYYLLYVKVSSLHFGLLPCYKDKAKVCHYGRPSFHTP